MHIVASSPEGLEKSLAEEINNYGGNNISISKRFVSFQCNHETFYRLHFFSKIAFRFYRQISSFQCFDKLSLYEGVKASFDWLKWLPTNKTFCVYVTGKNTNLTHSHFTALQVKNAIVDLQRANFGERSNISIDNPYLIIHLHLHENLAVLSLQSTIESLHKRGYRPAVGHAPLKENLAAGLMKITKWDGSVPLIDLMCGSSTLLIEGVSNALNSPIIKQNYLFKNWCDFNKSIFNQEILKIRKYSAKKQNLSNVIGCEIEKEVFLHAKKNINLAGFTKYIEIHNKDFYHLRLDINPGIIVCNPPYGKKIGEENELIELYSKIGIFLKNNYSGWEFWLLSGNPLLTKYLKMKASLKIPVSNGGIDCRWIKYSIK
tara:strand:+ start:79 stop:1200 length:1122 start_codon:yes stop_codon:yes gene_type:complete